MQQFIEKYPELVDFEPVIYDYPLDLTVDNPRIYVGSDFHINQWTMRQQYMPVLDVLGISPENYDLFLLAGDIGTPSKNTRQFYQDFLKAFADTGKPVLFIAGNHEYYGSNIEDTNALLNELCEPFDNVYFLENEAVHFPKWDLTVYGATWWIERPKGKLERFERFTDFRYIDDFNLESAITLHEQSQYKLHATVERLKRDGMMLNNSRFVLMTHHSPYKKTSQLYHQTQPNKGKGKLDRIFDPMFCNSRDIDWLQSVYIKPDLFVFGHTHINYCGKGCVKGVEYGFCINTFGYQTGTMTEPEHKTYRPIQIKL